MGDIFYLGFLSEPENPNDFYKHMGANIKMLYILRTFYSLGINVKVISLGMSPSNNFIKKVKINGFFDIFYVATLKYSAFISKSFLLFQIFLFIIIFVNKKDIIVFYHVKKILPLILFLKKLKNFTLILEVEENYSAVWGEGETEINLENKQIMQADKFIFVNDLYSKKLNISKSFIVCYGDYIQKKLKKNEQVNFEINLVYAGLITQDMYPDVYLAIDAMLHLDSHFNLKIIGYGENDSIEKLKKYIYDKKLSDRVKYDGLFVGEEYTHYLSKCDIGLNPRVLEDTISDYTFPSKVMTYLSHGLSVVSTTINCIKYSRISSEISFSIDKSPESFADAIKALKSRGNIKVNLDELNNDFRNELRGLVEK